MASSQCDPSAEELSEFDHIKRYPSLSSPVQLSGVSTTNLPILVAYNRIENPTILFKAPESYNAGTYGGKVVPTFDDLVAIKESTDSTERNSDGKSATIGTMPSLSEDVITWDIRLEAWLVPKRMPEIAEIDNDQDPNASQTRASRSASANFCDFLIIFCKILKLFQKIG